MVYICDKVINGVTWEVFQGVGGTMYFVQK